MIHLKDVPPELMVNLSDIEKSNKEDVTVTVSQVPDCSPP